MGVGKFFGAILIVGGVLVALLCGLCTTAVIAISVAAPATDTSANYGGGAMIPIALLLGGLPTVVGCLMIWGGIVLIRQRPKEPPPVQPD